MEKEEQKYIMRFVYRTNFFRLISFIKSQFYKCGVGKKYSKRPSQIYIEHAKDTRTFYFKVKFLTSSRPVSPGADLLQLAIVSSFILTFLISLSVSALVL